MAETPDVPRPTTESYPRMEDDELDDLRKWCAEDLDERFGIAQLIDLIDEARARHNCDLPDDHEGPCWFESGSPDD